MKPHMPEQDINNTSGKFKNRRKRRQWKAKKRREHILETIRRTDK